MVLKNKQKMINKIHFLIDFAIQEENKNNPYIQEYVQLAIRISQKIKYKLPLEIHQKICKRCYIIRNSKNTRYRTETKNNKKFLKITCLNCDYIKKIKIS
jgi:RNase P subunit RPR2